MVARAYISPKEYLEWEETQEERHEYHDGIIVAMSGGSLVHSLIGSNLVTVLTNQQKGRPCQTHGGGLKLHIAACNRYFYPDVAVICGLPNYTNNRTDTIDNAILVVEVLSDSTERFDRTIKLDCYGKLASIQVYILVSQDEPRIEKYTKIPGSDKWEYSAYTGLEAVVPLGEIGCELRAADVYDRIEFAPAAGADAGSINLAQ